MPRRYYVYILSSTRGTLYTGVTNDLMRRVAQHKNETGSAFTAKYSVNRLVYFEETTDVYKALDREKEIKSWRRSKKLALIREFNPTWIDLSEDW